VFEEATKAVCASKHPTLTNTIVMYNMLINACEDFVETSPRSEMLGEAVDAARSKLCDYYAKADAAVYPVATIIDPRVKLGYYEREGWEEECVLEAKATAKRVFDSYVPAQHEEAQPQPVSKGYKKSKAFRRRRNNCPCKDELRRYLGEKEVDDCPDFDVLQWWRGSAGTYPHLSRMARDYLAVPSTGAPAERAFSKGAELVDSKRASLDPETIKKSMCMQSWLKQ